MKWSRRIRRTLCAASPAHVVGLMTFAAAASNVWAEDLPASLLAAARLTPAGRDGGSRCYGLGELGDGPRLPYVMGDHRTGVAATADYSSSTIGAYLGAVPRGAAPPPLVQALVEAGAAKRVPLTWLQHTMLPGHHFQAQQDPASSGRAQQPDSSGERTGSAESDAFLVTGEDRAAFARPEPGARSGSPPAIDGSGPGPDFSADAQDTPPGVWQPSKICFRYSPVRVLEYGDAERQRNGVLTVSAAILVQADGMPAWARTYKVATAMPERPLPWEVQYWSFRDDGDGWRAEPLGNWLFLRGRTHIVRVGDP